MARQPEGRLTDAIVVRPEARRPLLYTAPVSAQLLASGLTDGAYWSLFTAVFIVEMIAGTFLWRSARRQFATLSALRFWVVYGLLCLVPLGSVALVNRDR